MPTTLYIVVVTTINSFQIFALIQLLTHGGPNYTTSTVMYLVYQTAISEGRFGVSSAMGIILAIITFTGLKITKRFLYHPYNVERFGTFDKNKDFVIIFHGIYGKAKTLKSITDTLEKEGYSGEELLKEFKVRKNNVKPAIQKLISDTEKNGVSYEDVFGED